MVAKLFLVTWLLALSISSLATNDEAKNQYFNYQRARDKHDPHCMGDYVLVTCFLIGNGWKCPNPENVALLQSFWKSYYASNFSANEPEKYIIPRIIFIQSYSWEKEQR